VHEEVGVPVEVRHRHPRDLAREEDTALGTDAARDAAIELRVRTVADERERRVGLVRQDVLREDANDPVLRLLARVPPGAEQAWPTLREPLLLDEVRVRVGPERAVEDLGLHRPRDDVDGRRHAALAPVRAQPLAEDDEPIGLVVDAREEPLVRTRQRHQHARLQELVLRQLLRQEHVVRGHQVRRVDDQ
jgi:hypothetical protein